MDTGYRLIMFVLGIVIIGFIAWDYLKHNYDLKELFENKIKKNKFRTNDLLSAASDYKAKISKFSNKVEPKVETDEIPINFPKPAQEPELDLVDEAEELEELEHEEYIEPVVELPSISLTVVARQKEGFSGRKLIYSLNNAKLHFGKNKIFHRHKLEDGSGDILFSVAKAVEPGFFNIVKLENENIPGVTLFMQLDPSLDNVKSFELLIKTAKQLAFMLNGELLDNDKQPLTLQTLADYKSMVKDNSKQGAMFEV